MIDHIKQTRFARFSARIVGWLQDEMAPALLRRRIIGVAIIASLLAAVYWLLVASDRYVSEAHVIVQRTDLSGGGSVDLTKLLGGSTGGDHADQLLLRDYLLSVDMLKKIDTELNLRAHYSNWHRDPLSRMWFQNAPIEQFYRYFISRVSVELDDYAGVLVIKAEGYDPDTAHAITAFMVREGERFMNEMAHKLAQDQVAFLEKQVAQMHERVMQTRLTVLDYQNKKGLVSPEASAENAAGIVSKLEAQRTELETQRTALQAYLVPNHPSIVQINQQIAAIERQIALEQGKLTSTNGKPLNRTVEEFQRLDMEAKFALEVYKTALVALEKERIEAARSIKKVSVLQAPTLPEYSEEPRRFYNTLVFMLIALLLSGVAHLIAAIVRDHKD
ncbi:MAG: chain-length determining protein [Sterolibacterium sp.]|nr:chain-length determining protein [Sterolibacterium sp.]